MSERREREVGRKRGREKENEKMREERRRKPVDHNRCSALVCTTVYLLMSTELLSTVSLPVLP